MITSTCAESGAEELEASTPASTEREKRSVCGTLFWFCVLFNAVFVACALLCETFSLQILLLTLSIGWLTLNVVVLLSWAFAARGSKRHAAAPFVAHICALSLAYCALSYSEPFAWVLKRNTMQRAVERIVREHPQQGAVPLNGDERWVLVSDDDGTVDVRRYGDDWTVLFITGDTLLSGYTGYLFSWRDRAPRRELHGGGYLEARERRAPRWFHVYSPHGWD